jgi:hypothetical protein
MGWQRFQAPTLLHPFGTDDLGRDELTRTLVGGQISLAVVVPAVVLSLTSRSITWRRRSADDERKGLDECTSMLWGWRDLARELIDDALAAQWTNA